MSNHPCICSVKPHIGQHTDIPKLFSNIRAALIAGTMGDRESFDHRSPDYEGPEAGLSNKSINIAARDLLRRTPKDFDEAWNVVMSMVVGDVR